MRCFYPTTIFIQFFSKLEETLRKSLIFLLLVLCLAVLSATEKDRLAVMDVQDEAGILDEKAIITITDYIFTKFQGTGLFWMIPKSDRDTALDKAIEETKISSRKECVDEKCQLSLVAELQANFLINTKIKKLYEGICQISISKFDVEKNAGVFSWESKFDCGEKAVYLAIDSFRFDGKNEDKSSLSQEKTADKNACNYAKEKNDSAIWEKYLSKYSKGVCSFEAASRIEEIKRKKKKEWSKISSKEMTWSEAKKYCENSEWRLPTISELKSLVKNCSATIVNCKISDECLFTSCDSKGCKGCLYANDGRYSTLNDSEDLWSASEVHHQSDNVWYLGFGDGASIYSESKSAKHKFRCIR